MKIAVYPGTFDPVTNGHLDILMRASSIFDVVYVAIVINLRKEPLFSTDERIKLVRECTKDFSNVQIEKFNGLVVDFAQKVGATVVIRGLRAISDFDYEFQMALTNRQLNENVDTVFLMPHKDYTYLSSSTIREIAKFNGDVSGFVPDVVRKAMARKFRSKKWSY